MMSSRDSINRVKPLNKTILKKIDDHIVLFLDMYGSMNGYFDEDVCKTFIDCITFFKILIKELKLK